MLQMANPVRLAFVRDHQPIWIFHKRLMEVECLVRLDVQPQLRKLERLRDSKYR